MDKQSDRNRRGRLTTHVLDTARGRPAAGVRIELFRLTGDSRRLITTTNTNNDGRTDAPLLTGDQLMAGVYELVFHAGDYIRAESGDGDLFLNVIPVRFTITDPGEHYHVPLLLSPFGYATYRGS